MLTAIFVSAPMLALAQGVGAGYPNPNASSPYALNNVNPSAGITTPGSTYPSMAQSPSQFSNRGANTLYGNYGNAYVPELPNNVYGQDIQPKEPTEEAAPAQGAGTQ